MWSLVQAPATVDYSRAGAKKKIKDKMLPNTHTFLLMEAYLLSHPIHWWGTLSEERRGHPFSFSSLTAFEVFVSVSHVAVSVEHNFTGSEENHSVICSSISAATRSTPMPHTGGPQDYRLGQLPSLLLAVWDKTQRKKISCVCELFMTGATILIQINYWLTVIHRVLSSTWLTDVIFFI